MPLTEDFDRHGVISRSALDRMLSEYAGSESFIREMWDFAHQPGPLASLLGDLRWHIYRAGDAIRDYSPGISQFTVLKAPVIDDEHLRKSLFLAARSTFIFPEKIHITSYEDVTPDDAKQYEGWGVEVSAEFIRHLFDYRGLIDSGAVRLLGSSIGYTSQFAQTKTHVTADELPDMRALAVGDNEEVARLASLLRSNRQVLDLATTYVPWIAQASLDDVVKLRSENEDLLSDFQRAYHKALVEQISHGDAVDFGRISRQIEGDVIRPSLRTIERRYAREIANHRRLRNLGATVAFLPLAAAVTAEVVTSTGNFQSLVLSVAPTVSALTNAVLINRFQRKLSSDALLDSPFFLL